MISIEWNAEKRQPPTPYHVIINAIFLASRIIFQTTAFINIQQLGNFNWEFNLEDQPYFHISREFIFADGAHPNFFAEHTFCGFVHNPRNPRKPILVKINSRNLGTLPRNGNKRRLPSLAGRISGLAGRMFLLTGDIFDHLQIHPFFYKNQ